MRLNKKFFRIAAIFFLCLVSFLFGVFSQTKQEKNPLTASMVGAASKLFGFEFSQKKVDLMLPDLHDQQKNYKNIRSVPLENSVTPSLMFSPLPDGYRFESTRKPFRVDPAGGFQAPLDENELAFSSVVQLAELIKTKKISSERLTRIYLERLKKYGPKLECVVTLTEELALRQAKAADDALAAGKYYGLLHGIPYGAKDLLATKQYPTTWGTAPYQQQSFKEDATVIQRLEAAGAVLVAKLTLGELAWGDVWFGGTTKNPWNYKQGSSGSSAGSASATSAGLVPFAIGSETWGSIVSPSSRCGITGLRPTYGRVSRKGAMALTWSMDKLGPICRTVEDCAVVFHAIYGPDSADPSVYDAPFNYPPETSWKKLRIGYLKNDFEQKDEKGEPDDPVDESSQNDQASIAKMQELGVNLIPVALPKLPVSDLTIILGAEAAAAFDELTLSGKVDLMKRQERNAWPNVFRAARFIPAVEYIQANRIRHLLINQMHELMSKVDVILAPSFKGDGLLLTNLTGHPCVVLPNGFKKDGTPTSITFIGKLFGEAEVLAVSKAYQDATGFHLKRPPLQP